MDNQVLASLPEIQLHQREGGEKHQKPPCKIPFFWNEGLQAYFFVVASLASHKKLFTASAVDSSFCPVMSVLSTMTCTSSTLLPGVEMNELTDETRELSARTIVKTPMVLDIILYNERQL